jgi:RNA polymerase sigma-70 factor (ECF subfamily)
MPAMPTSGFHTTSWTLVCAAADKPTADSREALAALCQKYWHPVYAFVRRRGYDREQSQDLTQGFFAVLIEKNYLLDTDRQRGKFRSFLLAAVKHFLANEWDRANALKRGGGLVAVSIDTVEAEAWQESAVVEHVTPETLFERRWALSLLENVMVRLRSEFVNEGRAEEFEKLSAFLNRDSETTGYETVAEEMGVSAGALRMSVHRIRRKYRRLLRAELAETMPSPDPDQIDDELRHIMSVLSV